MHRAIRIGVTGKLGSGKSTLSRMMAEHGFTVISSDDVAKELMQSDPHVRTKIAALLGGDAYKDSQLDTKYVASRIFADATLLERLEAIVHPAVTAFVESVFATHGAGEIVAVESALILKTAFQDIFDYVILVDIPDDLAVQHAVASGKMTEADARARLEQQDYANQRLSEADFVIQNAGSLEDFTRKAKTLLLILDTLRSRDLPETPLHSIEDE